MYTALINVKTLAAEHQQPQLKYHTAELTGQIETRRTIKKCRAKCWPAKSQWRIAKKKDCVMQDSILWPSSDIRNSFKKLCEKQDYILKSSDYKSEGWILQSEEFFSQVSNVAWQVSASFAISKLSPSLRYVPLIVQCSTSMLFWRRYPNAHK